MVAAAQLARCADILARHRPECVSLRALGRWRKLIMLLCEHGNVSERSDADGERAYVVPQSLYMRGIGATLLPRIVELYYSLDAYLKEVRRAEEKIHLSFHNACNGDDAHLPLVSDDDDSPSAASDELLLPHLQQAVAFDLDELGALPRLLRTVLYPPAQEKAAQLAADGATAGEIAAACAAADVAATSVSLCTTPTASKKKVEWMEVELDQGAIDTCASMLFSGE